MLCTNSTPNLHTVCLPHFQRHFPPLGWDSSQAYPYSPSGGLQSPLSWPPPASGPFTQLPFSLLLPSSKLSLYRSSVDPTSKPPEDLWTICLWLCWIGQALSPCPHSFTPRGPQKGKEAGLLGWLAVIHSLVTPCQLFLRPLLPPDLRSSRTDAPRPCDRVAPALVSDFRSACTSLLPASQHLPLLITRTHLQPEGWAQRERPFRFSKGTVCFL